MLAKTFKSASELGIEESFYEALVKVYWMLSDEVIPADLFRMDTVGGPRIQEEECCGTAGCILGWARAVGKKRYHSDFDDVKRGTHRLFYPDHVVGSYGADRQQAARALLGYLTTGKDAWQEAMKRGKK